MPEPARTIPPILMLLATVVVAPSCSGDGAEPDPPADGVLGLALVSDGLDGPVHLTAPAGDDRLFVVEQPGRIRVIENGAVLATPFLDIRDRVRSGGEQGLLSLAFHPDYATNGTFFIYFTDLQGDTRVERYRVSGDPDVADPASSALVLALDQPYSNHNGGLLLFGPDDMLYIGLGDGGSAGDPDGNGQDPSTLLGSLLRIDVDAGAPYGVPPDNPFADGVAGAPEVWAYGLRNPWRFAFDQGLLYIADVGQNAWEEVSVQPADAAGLNYGWDRMEGAHCFEPASGCETAGLVLPVLEYPHDEGCSITGGVVYRGADVPVLQGRYLYADWCSGWIRSFIYQAGEATDAREHDVAVERPVSFGVDGAGEVYVLSGSGAVYRLEAG